MGTDHSALDDLESRIRQALATPEATPRRWLSDGGPDLDVAVIGAGQSGVAIVAALRRAGIDRVAAFDAAPPREAGIWRGIARMRTLRTRKDIPGPEDGLSLLGFAAWFDAVHGPGAFERLDLIPTLEWADYLDWYRGVVGVEPHYNYRLVTIEPTREGFRLGFNASAGTVTITSRKLVLATGITGIGAPFIPDVVRESLPAHLYAHTHSPIDFASLRGKRVAVLGAASSAFDAASTALEAGAAEVGLFSRHAALAFPPSVVLNTHFGASAHFDSLPDAVRWRYVRHARARGNVPAQTVTRATRFANFRLHLNAPWSSASVQNDTVVIEAAGRRHVVDFVIAGTGYTIDPALRPELGDFASRIALWKDRYTPPEGERCEALDRTPYLSAGFAFQEKEAGTAPFLRDIHAFGYGAVTSFGRHIGDIATMKFTIPRLVDTITRDLLLADVDFQLAELLSGFANARSTDEAARGAR